MFLNFKMAADTTGTCNFNLELWLKVADFPEHTAAFTSHGLVSYEKCINLSEDDLRAVGVNNDVHVELLMDRVKELRKLSEEDAVKLLSVSTRNKCTVCIKWICNFFWSIFGIMWKEQTRKPHPDPKPLEKLMIVDGGRSFHMIPFCTHS